MEFENFIRKVVYRNERDKVKIGDSVSQKNDTGLKYLYEA